MFKWTCLATVVTFAMGCGEVSRSQSARTSTTAEPVRSAPSAPSGDRATADEIRQPPPELKAHFQDLEGNLPVRYKVIPGNGPYPPGHNDVWEFEQGRIGPPRR